MRRVWSQWDTSFYDKVDLIGIKSFNFKFNIMEKVTEHKKYLESSNLH